MNSKENFVFLYIRFLRVGAIHKVFYDKVCPCLRSMGSLNGVREPKRTLRFS